MADDGTQLNPGSGGNIIADERMASGPSAGQHIARAKLVVGDFGDDGGDVSSSNPMPVRGSALAGASLPPDAFMVGFTDGTDLRPARVYDLDTLAGGEELALGVVLRKSTPGGSVELGTPSAPVRVDPTGTTAQPVTAASLPLPAGAATESTVGNRFFGGKTTAATVIAFGGDNVIRTPATGKTLTLYWVSMTSSQNNTNEVLATVKLGSKIVYETYLGNPGAFAHWEPVVADNPNDALVVNLSMAGQSVAVSYTVTEE